MDKKQIYVLIALIIFTIGFGFAAAAANQHTQIKTNAAVVKAQAERDSAIKQVAQHDAANKLNVDSLTAQNQTLAGDKLALCAQLKAAKLANPRCQ